MVLVIRYAVVTQAWPARSLRWSAMTRIALATMVWSSAARNIPIIRPTRMVRISLWESTGRRSGPAPAGASAVASTRGGSAVVSDMSVLFLLLVSGGVEGHGGRRCTPGPEVGVERITELAQPRDELRGHRPVPVGEQPLEPRCSARLDSGEGAPAVLGEGDDPGAPVARVGALLEMPGADERADLPADGRGVVVQGRGELGDADGAGARDDEEHGVCRDVHAVLEPGRAVLGRDEELLHAQEPEEDGVRLVLGDGHGVLLGCRLVACGMQVSVRTSWTSTRVYNLCTMMSRGRHVRGLVWLSVDSRRRGGARMT